MKLNKFMNPAEGILRMAADAGVAVGGIGSGAATVEQEKTIVARTGDPTYLKNDLEKKLVLIAPSSTPIDTITREIGNTRKTKSIETGGWEIAVRDIDDKVAANVSAGESGVRTGTITITKAGLWKPGDTFAVFNATIGLDNPVRYYVDSVSSTSLTVTRIGDASFPALAKDDKIIRMDKAMNELDAQTDVLYQTPTNRTNYCQLHMAQVEESVIHSLHEKEVAFDFTTMKEQTIYDLKWQMEMSNLWGVKDYFVNAAGKAIYTSDGLWNQIENMYSSSASSWTNAQWIDFTRTIWDGRGGNGSDRRIALVGPRLMALWATVPSLEKQLTADSVEVVLGVKFNKVITNFGELLVKCAPNTFIGDNTYKGIVIDPAYVRRDVFEALQSTPLDLDATGQRRVKAERLLENYCLYVENQPVHTKIKVTL